MKPEVSTFHIVVIFFPRLCILGGPTIIFCRLLYIHLGIAGFYFHDYCQCTQQSMMYANRRNFQLKIVVEYKLNIKCRQSAVGKPVENCVWISLNLFEI